MLNALLIDALDSAAKALKITFTNWPAISMDGGLSTPTKIVGYLKYLIQYSVRTWKI